MVMNKKIEQLLPIGTVVRIKGAKKRIMIHGIMIKIGDTNYDYAGVLYPEGLLGTESQIAFQAEDIDIIDFIGVIDAESQAINAEQGIKQESEESNE